jgi:putative flippase GtrA
MKIKKLKKYQEIINYLIIGVLTTIVSLAIYYLLVYTILNPENFLQLQVANVLSWIGSVLFAYITNRKFVFQSQSREVTKEFASFIGSRLLTLLADMLIMFLGVTLLHFNDKIVKLLSQFVVIAANYILSKCFVFKKNS